MASCPVDRVPTAGSERQGTTSALPLASAAVPLAPRKRRTSPNVSQERPRCSRRIVSTSLAATSLTVQVIWLGDPL